MGCLCVYVMSESQNAAAQYETMDEQTRADIEYEAWSEVAQRFANQHSELHDLLDNADAWNDMNLEVWRDDNGRKYFKILTGIHYSPNDHSKKMVSEAAHEFLQNYRNELVEIIREQ